MTSLTKRLVAVSAVALIFLAGCSSDSGGDDDASSTSGTESQVVNLDEWLMQIDAVCADYNDQFDELGDPPDDIGGFSEYVAEGTELAQAQLEEITAVPTPDEMQEEVEQAIDLLQENTALFEELQAAADDEDLAAIEDVVEQGAGLDAELDEVAAELGLEECGADDESTTDGTGTDDTGSDGTGSGGGVTESNADAFIEATSTGLVEQGFTQEEADCIIDGLLDEYSLDEINGFVDEGTITDAITDIVIDCVSTERLLEVGAG